MRLRGRKGIREALEQQKDLVILNPADYKGRWAEFFDNGLPIHVELGMGKGKFMSEMSAKYPTCNFIGIDRYDELLRRASEKVRLVRQEQNGSEPDNVALALFNIEFIEQIFAEGEIERIYLNFSDPWPKKRHARRRLTHANFVRKYIQLLNDKGEIHLKTDSNMLFEFSLNSFADMDLRMRNITLDLHREGAAPDNVMTEYESKFFDQGMNIYRCEVVVGRAALEQHVKEVQQRKE